MSTKGDDIWKALADSTRRQILDLLKDGPKTTSEIVEQFPDLSRFGVMKHLDVLRAVKLVNTRTEGRTRINTLNANPLRQIVERWISKYEGFWANTLLRVRDAAEEQTGSKKRSDSSKKSKRKKA